MLTIRRANDGDANLLADLGRRTFYETFAASNKAEDMDAYSGAAFAIHRIAGELRREATTFFVAETPTKPVGFAKLEASGPPPCVTGPSPVRLHKLYVSADVIGTGVGAALMRFGIDWARTACHETMWLWGSGSITTGPGLSTNGGGSSRSGPRPSASGRTIRSIC